MKIDLHVHTIKTKLDNSNRNIPSVEQFIAILNKSNVGIAAITNHNKFDMKQFNEIVSKNINKILFLPGIELNVKLNDSVKHLNLIFDPKHVDELINFINKNKIDDDKFTSIEIEKVISELGNSNKCFFCLDYKNDKKFTKEEIKKYFVDNNNFSSAYLLDISKEKLFDFFLYWNENSLIGSDNKDWKTYEQYSNKLVEYNNLIKDFSDLYDIFKNNFTYNFFKNHNLIENFNNNEIILYNENKKGKPVEVSYIPNIKLVKSGVNVIFGPKASGKSSLLKSLYKNLKVDESKKSYFDAVDTINEEKVIKSIVNDNDFFEIEKNNFNEELKEILKYSENIEYRSTMKDFFYWIKNKKIGKNNLINIEDKRELAPKNNGDIKKIVESFKQIIKKYIEINDGNVFDSDIELINQLIINLKNKYIDINLLYWKFNFRSKTTQIIKNISKNHKQEYSKIWTFGLKEKFLFRKNLLSKIIKINNLFKNNNTIKKIEEIYVPIENSEKMRKWNIISKLNLGWKSGEKNHFDSRTSTYRNNIEKLLKTNNYASSIKIIEELNKNKSEDIFKLTFHFECDGDENRKPSTGELSFIKLINELKKDKIEYFFLDEPETHLNNNFISTHVLSKIIKLTKNKKTLIISTLNNILGINTNPMNYILRETININYKDYKCNETWIGNISERYLTSCYDETRKLNINEKILEYFEGKRELYNYRKKVYGED